MPSSITPDPTAPIASDRRNINPADNTAWALALKFGGSPDDWRENSSDCDDCDSDFGPCDPHAREADERRDRQSDNARLRDDAAEAELALQQADAEIMRLRAELEARPTRAAVLREAKAEVVAWLVKKAREDTPVWRLADKVDRGAVRIFLEADTAEAAEQWAERDRRVAKLNARVEAHNQGEHAFCGDECDEIWHQGGAQ